MEESETWVDYERKEHNFVSWEDTTEVLKCRYGKLNALQHCILKLVSDQNDREVDVFLDKKGNSGKTWLAKHMWEKGDVYYVPRSASGSGKISADCCLNCGQSKYIIIDVQRDKKFDTSFYSDIEELKDGLVSDVRWYGKQRNISGRKLIIFTNQPLDTKKLSADRWRLHGTNLRDLEMELHEKKLKRVSMKNVKKS